MSGLSLRGSGGGPRACSQQPHSVQTVRDLTSVTCPLPATSLSKGPTTLQFPHHPLLSPVHHPPSQTPGLPALCAAPPRVLPAGDEPQGWPATRAGRCGLGQLTHFQASAMKPTLSWTGPSPQLACPAQVPLSSSSPPRPHRALDSGWGMNSRQLFKAARQGLCAGTLSFNIVAVRFTQWCLHPFSWPHNVCVCT